MRRTICAVKEELEAKVRDAVAREKELETELPEPEERKTAQNEVEVASLNLINHPKQCTRCCLDAE